MKRLSYLFFMLALMCGMMVCTTACSSDKSDDDEEIVEEGGGSESGNAMLNKMCEIEVWTEKIPAGHDDYDDTMMFTFTKGDAGQVVMQRAYYYLSEYDYPKYDYMAGSLKSIKGNKLTFKKVSGSYSGSEITIECSLSGNVLTIKDPEYGTRQFVPGK